jgi:indole-3-glycerol phosphate synthase
LSSVLKQIFETKREEVSAAKRHVPMSVLEDAVAQAPPPRGFRAALAAATTDVALIAEIKKASPSKGVIREDFDPEQITRTYEQSGAHCLSVLTDTRYFQGSAANLILARAASNLPILRKDFIFDSYQVYEARSWGADAILLIAAELSRAQLDDLRQVARALEMDVLIEVHIVKEAELALELGFDLIGVNNRDLKSLDTSLQPSLDLLPLISKQAFAVSESAIRSKKDIEQVKVAGARAVLVGTTFCAAPDIGAKVKQVMGW